MPIDAVNRVQYTRITGSATSETRWRKVANRIVAIFNNIKELILHWLGYSKPFVRRARSPAEEVRAPLLLLSPPPVAPHLASQTQNALTAVVDNYITLTLEKMPLGTDPIQIALLNWIRVASHDKSDVISGKLGALFDDLNYTNLMDRMIEALNAHLHQVMGDREYKDTIKKLQGTLSSLWATSDERAFAREFLETEFPNMEAELISDRDIEAKVTLERPFKPIDFRAQASVLVDLLDLGRPVSEISEAEKTAREQLLEALVVKIPGNVSGAAILACFNQDGLNALVKEALIGIINQQFNDLLQQFSSPLFVHERFGKNIFPTLLRKIQTKKKEASPAIEEIPAAYRELAFKVTELVFGSSGALLASPFKDKLATLILETLYEYRNSRALMQDVMQEVQESLVNYDDFKTTVAPSPVISVEEAKNRALAALSALIQASTTRAQEELASSYFNRPFTYFKDTLTDMATSRAQAIYLEIFNKQSRTQDTLVQVANGALETLQRAAASRPVDISAVAAAAM